MDIFRSETGSLRETLFGLDDERVVGTISLALRFKVLVGEGLRVSKDEGLMAAEDSATEVGALGGAGGYGDVSGAKSFGWDERPRLARRIYRAC